MLTKNGTLSLNCTSCGGYPRPEIKWFHQNELVYNNGSISSDAMTVGTCVIGRLSLTNLSQVYHKDSFFCVAENGFLYNKSSPSVQVLFEPRDKTESCLIFMQPSCICNPNASFRYLLVSSTSTDILQIGDKLRPDTEQGISNPSISGIPIHGFFYKELVTVCSYFIRDHFCGSYNKTTNSWGTSVSEGLPSHVSHSAGVYINESHFWLMGGALESGISADTTLFITNDR